jgi:DNA polymerase-3 subunit beta
MATASRASPCPARRVPKGMPDIIVPRKCVAEMRKLLDEADRQCPFRSTCRHRRSASPLNGVILTSKLIDGTFPDYSRVIPTGERQAAAKSIPRRFSQGVDRVATIATEKTRAVKMALDKDKVTLSVTSPENGTAAEEVSAEYSERRVRDRLQRRYLMDILARSKAMWWNSTSPMPARRP